jgi:hypothetical protein
MIQLQPYLRENLKPDTIEQVAELISDRQDEYAGNSMTVAVIATIVTELLLWATISGVMGLIHHLLKR